MTVTGHENHDIPLSEASAWTKNYRIANPGTPDNPTVLGHYFGMDAINAILAQTGCVGIRIYYALDDSGVKQVIICGVTVDGNDLYNGQLAERSYNCPPQCSANNPLNSNV
jgi:hypothetical protein